jgi:hypothetical protein
MVAAAAAVYVAGSNAAAATATTVAAAFPALTMGVGGLVVAVVPTTERETKMILRLLKTT